VAALAGVARAEDGDLRAADPAARFRAAQALRGQGAAAKAALPELVELLKDEQPYVRVEAGRALVAIGITEKEVAPLVARLGLADPEVGLLVAEALAGLGEPAMPELVKALAGKDERARRGAITAVGLAGRHAAAAVPDLLDLLASEDPATRKLAGEALRRCAPWAAEYVPEILDRLRFGKDEVRWAAASVLARIGPAAKEAVQALREMRAEGNEQLSSAAAEALARIEIGGARGPAHPALLDPKLASEEAPERFRARFETTRGVFVVEVERAWAPHGADRFYNLVRCGFYDGASFFRVIDGFVAQFGLSGDSRVNGAWSGATIPDDPRKESNRRGTITYAKVDAPDSRTTQVFVNLSDNTRLDELGFAPFGRVVAGLDVVERLYAGYGDGPPGGKGPDQRAITTLGDQYLKREFPLLDAIERATVLEAGK
jgi:peptidyl-prolyl cis-trans isomerase A (cyclophilin A)